MKKYRDERVGNLPNVAWATNKKTLNKQLELAKQHSETMIRNMINKKEIIKVTSQPQRPQFASKYILNKYPYPQEMALKSVELPIKR